MDRNSNANGQLGYKIIPDNFNWQNIPSDYANSIWEINYSFDLNGESISIPPNVILKFDGGLFLNGSISFDNTGFEAPSYKIFAEDVTLTGNVNVETLKIEWFGAVSDARNADGSLNPTPYDSHSAIQRAIKFAVVHRVGMLTCDSSSSFYCSKLLLLPTLTNNKFGYLNIEKVFVLDFNGSEFIGSGNAVTDHGWIESAYFESDGSLQSTYTLGSADNERYLFSQYVLKNVRLFNFSRGVRIKNWIYGCEINHIMGREVGQIIVTKRCFYTNFNLITNRGAVDSSNNGLADFEFNDNNNIMPLKSLVTGSHSIGYKFTGASEALRMVDCGIEICSDAGVVINGRYNIKFESCYFENVGVGVRALSPIDTITFDNCWGYGDHAMFETTSDNANVNVLPNNVLGNGCRWYDSLPNYNLSTLNLKQDIKTSGSILENYVGPDAINVNKQTIIYDQNVGLNSVLGRADNTTKYHAGKYTGKYGGGFLGVSKMIGVQYSVDSLVGGTQKARWKTGIDYSDTQCIYVALKVAHNLGIWEFYGHIVGDKLVAIYESEYRDYEVNEVNGKVELALNFPSGGALGPFGGEIRLI